MTNDKTVFNLSDGVYVSAKAQKQFELLEQSYLLTRNKEDRILSIEQIQQLPNVPIEYAHFKEWQIRKKNISRFKTYLNQKAKGLRILDVGCGNGFFTNMMAEGNKVVGVDVNLIELKQAAAAFKNSSVNWYYIDIINETLPEASFDIITFCASFQYFPDPEKLLNKCLQLLNSNGEIHIIDSPFYTEKTKDTAKHNSANYYRKLGTAGMINFYQHNTYSLLKRFNSSFKYQPNNFLMKLFQLKDSPFPWIVIKNE